MRSHCRFFAAAVALLACSTVAKAADIPNLTPLEQSFISQLGTDETPVHRGPGPNASGYVDPRIQVMTRFVGPALTMGTADQLRQQILANRPGLPRLDATVNGGFESGDLTGWTTQGNAGTGTPSVCGSAMPAEAIVVPIGLQAYANNDPLINQVHTGAFACRLGDDLAWGFAPATEPQCSQVFQDVALPSGTVNFAFSYAVLASNPGHGFGNDPYFNVRVEDLTVPSVLYDVTDYTTSYNPGNPCNPWCLGGFDANGGSPVVYRRWQQVVLNLSSIAGHTVRLSLKSSDCSPSAHFCEAFLDDVGTPCSDTLPPDPSPIAATCAPDGSGGFCATVTWNAPSDPTVADVGGVCTPGTGSASAYDIRWSTSPIVTIGDYTAANLASGEPAPATPGTPESFLLCGLPTGDVYVAMQSLDANFNRGPLTTAHVNCVNNRNPDCSAAAATIAELWPPNHQFVNVGVTGVTDPDGDPVTITVTSVSQDEPLNTIGDGNTCPDAQLQGSTVDLRAERTGNPKVPGDGRVYVVHFTASDGQGGSCSGTVNVCVPHDQGEHHYCVDTGQLFNSLDCDPSLNATEDAGNTWTISDESLRRGEVEIQYGLKATGTVDIAIFDILGRRVLTLESGVRESGTHSLVWNTRGVANGMYFARMTTANKTVTRAVPVVR
jgi:hypothetical protein